MCLRGAVLKIINENRKHDGELIFEVAICFSVCVIPFLISGL